MYKYREQIAITLGVWVWFCFCYHSYCCESTDFFGSGKRMTQNTLNMVLDITDFRKTQGQHQTCVISILMKLFNS